MRERPIGAFFGPATRPRTRNRLGFKTARKACVSKDMFKYQAQWADLPAVTVTPCLEDADAGAVLESLGKR